MHFITFSSLSALALSALSYASAAIVAPANGTTIDPGATFAFDYENSNECESGYSPISVWLSTSAPTSSDISGGELVSGSYIYKFGDWLIPNFGEDPKAHAIKTLF